MNPAIVGECVAIDLQLVASLGMQAAHDIRFWYHTLADVTGVSLVRACMQAEVDKRLAAAEKRHAEAASATAAAQERLAGELQKHSSEATRVQAAAEKQIACVLLASPLFQKGSFLVGSQCM